MLSNALTLSFPMPYNGITLRVLPRLPEALASPSLSPMVLARVRSCLWYWGSRLSNRPWN